MVMPSGHCIRFKMNESLIENERKLPEISVEDASTVGVKSIAGISTQGQ
jgi:hypothetical protein